ncbi:McrC family protein [Clostridium sp. LP20]|uniref:McrC family protein n=1 Tax=Clostridium sp. LP20 TaxID=3418665 RepID=UPI003EE6D6E3
MDKLILEENKKYIFADNEKDVIPLLLELNAEIKKELGLRKLPFQFLNDRTIYVSGIIGNLTFGNLNILVYPKFCSNENSTYEDQRTRLQRLYLRTLKCAKENIKSVVYFSKYSINGELFSFADAIAEHYIQCLSRALGQCKISQYEQKEERLSAIRGKILIQKQISSPIVDAKTWCRYKQISENNEFNQLLAWTCTFLAGLTSDVRKKKKLHRLRSEIDTSPNNLTVQVVKKLNLPKQFSAYTESFQLAKNLFIGNSCKAERKIGGNTINGYIINMERSFENIISYYIKKASSSLKMLHKAQAKQLLAINNNTNSLDYYVKPDDLLNYKGNDLVLDAKYKVLSDKSNINNKPSREDLYQIVCSCIAYEANEAILFYPINTDRYKQNWTISKQINNRTICISAIGIDIFLDDNMLISNICEVVKNTSFYRGVINEQ